MFRPRRWLMLASSAASGAIGWQPRTGAADRESSSDLNPVRAKTLLSRRARRTNAAESNGAGCRSFRAGSSNRGRTAPSDDVLRCAGRRGLCRIAQSLSIVLRFKPVARIGPGDFVASCDGSGSQLVDRDSGQPLAASDDPSIVVYRVVFPVALATPTPNRNPEPGSPPCSNSAT